MQYLLSPLHTHYSLLFYLYDSSLGSATYVSRALPSTVQGTLNEEGEEAAGYFSRSRFVSIRQEKRKQFRTRNC